MSRTVVGAKHTLGISLLLILFSLGCGSRHSLPIANHDTITPQPDAALNSLPSPDAALLRMGKAAGDPVYERFGREYDAASSQRATAEGDCVRFSPDWSDGTGGVDGLAFGVFEFNLTGYAGAPSFSLAWADAPGNLSNVWLGLSDWEQGRWKWFACPAGDVLDLPDPPGLAPYIKAGTGEMLAVFVMTGQEPGVLHQCGVQFAAISDSWPVFGHDVKHTGRSMNLGPTTNALKWKFKTHDPATVFSSPVITADGTAYVLDDYGNGRITVLNSDGTLRWQEWIRMPSGLAVSPSGTVYVGTQDAGCCCYRAFGPDGTELSTFYVRLPLDSIIVPVEGADGAIYIAASGYLLILNPDGTLRYEFSLGTAPDTPIVVGPDNAIYGAMSGKITKFDASGNMQWQAGPYMGDSTLEFLPLASDTSGAVFTCLNGVLTALNADGTTRWTSINMNIESQPVIATDGTIFVGGYQDPSHTSPAFFAVNPDGTVKWQIAATTDVETPYLAPDGTVYFADDHLRAVTPDGVEQWACPLKVRGEGRIAADAAGRLYVVGTYSRRTYGDARSQLYAINPAGSTIWTYGAGGGIQAVSEPVIGEDGTIYFGSRGGDAYAVYPDGTEKWHYATDASVRCSTTVTPENEVFVLDDLGSLHALDATGTLRWIYNLDYYTQAAFGAPIVGPDGVVYFGDDGEWHDGANTIPGQYHAINADGTLKWNHIFESWVTMVAALRDDGSTLVSSFAGDLHCFSADGTVLWENTLVRANNISSAIAPDSTLYFASFNLNALKYDGTVKWSTGAPHNLGAPAIAVDGTVYYSESEPGYNASRIRAVGPDGVELWTSDVVITDMTALSIDGAGCIYASDYYGVIYEFNPDGSLKQTFETTSYNAMTPVAIGSGNTIYVGSGDGNLYAFGE